jgi:hypothetical protein
LDAALELDGAVPRLGDRVVEGRAWPTSRLPDADALTGVAEQPRGVLAVLIGVEGDGWHMAAAHRDRLARELQDFFIWFSSSFYLVNLTEVDGLGELAGRAGGNSGVCAGRVGS